MLDEWVREHGIEAAGVIGGLVSMWFGLKRKQAIQAAKHSQLRRDFEEHVEEQARKWKELRDDWIRQRREDKEDRESLAERVERKIDAAVEQLGQALKPMADEILRLRQRSHDLANDVMEDRGRIRTLEKIQGIEERG